MNNTITVIQIYNTAYNRANARKTFKGLDKKRGIEAVNIYIQLMAETLIKGELFYVPEVGTFEIVKVPIGLKNNLVVTDKKEYIATLEKYGHRLTCNGEVMEKTSSRIKMGPKLKILFANYTKAFPNIKFRIVKDEHKKEGIY